MKQPRHAEQTKGVADDLARFLARLGIEGLVLQQPNLDLIFLDLIAPLGPFIRPRSRENLLGLGVIELGDELRIAAEDRHQSDQLRQQLAMSRIGRRREVMVDRQQRVVGPRRQRFVRHADVRKKPRVQLHRQFFRFIHRWRDQLQRRVELLLELGNFVILLRGQLLGADANRHAIKRDQAFDLGLKIIVAQELPHDRNDVPLVAVEGNFLSPRQIELEDSPVWNESGFGVKLRRLDRRGDVAVDDQQQFVRHQRRCRTRPAGDSYEAEKYDTDHQVEVPRSDAGPVAKGVEGIALFCCSACIC